MADNSVTDGIETALGNLSTWASQPFTTQMSITGWAWFTGLILVLCVLWFMVLHEIRGEL